MPLLVIVELVYIESLKEYQTLEKLSVTSIVTYKSTVLSHIANKGKGNMGVQW